VTGFTFTVEDLKSAPVEVRRWLAGRMESELSALRSAAPVSPPVPAPALATCTLEEAAGMFELLKGDFAATHVLLELARDEPGSNPAAPLHAVNIGTLMRNTRLDDHRLVSCLRTITHAFQEVRGDPQATLFGFDQANHIYIHEATHRSVQALWQELARLHAPTDAKAVEPVDWSGGFQPRRLGPSDDIATHQPH